MIRPATPTDAPGIMAIWNPIIRDTAITFTDQEKTEQDICTLIAERAALGRPVLVDQTGAEPVRGVASYNQFRAGTGYAQCMEHTILLAPQARGQGSGRAMMQALEGHARAAGHRSLVGGVSGGNASGIAFHLALGFVMAGRITAAGWKLGAFHDLVFMQKML